MSESEVQQSSPQDETQQHAAQQIPGGFKNFVLRSYCWFLILSTLYVLSIGPMYWHWYDAQHTGQGSRLVILFYTPLAIACDNIEPLDKWVQWYLGLWT